MKFFSRKKPQTGVETAVSPSETPIPKELKPLIAPADLRHYLMLFAAGAALAAAFPPFEWSITAFFAPAVLFLLSGSRSWKSAAMGGWIWGMGYAFFSFMWLREIQPLIPLFMMAVLGAFYIPVGWAAAVFKRHILLPEDVFRAGYTAQSKFKDYPLLRQLMWCLSMASVWVVVEYLRSMMLPWNYLGITLYRNTILLQLAAYTGVSGLSFVLAFINAALALAIQTVAAKREDGRTYYRRPWPFMIALAMLMLIMVLGVYRLRDARRAYSEYTNSARMTLVQGQISQRRFGGEDSAREALTTYIDLTRTQVGVPTDLVVWPETAIAYPLRGNARICAEYRANVRMLSQAMKAPMLLGTLDFDLTQNPPGSLNSAVIIDQRDFLREGYLGMYSKVHRVPFGEYVPFRKYLPQWLVRIIDMHRDLTPGKSLEPLQLGNMKLGISICFEDVFSYIAREEFYRGANLLLVITNDAWYPTSSEPAQHLAHAIVRSIETNLPMVRCGNDSASCVIAPSGEIIWSMAEALKFGNGEAYDRGAGAATITVKYPDSEQRKPTFYTRYKDWLVLLSILITVIALTLTIRRAVKN